MQQVSLIVTVYNLEACLEETLESLLAQTYENLEIICVDDGSTDKSPALLARFAEKDSRVRIITQANAGAGAARNRGLAEAQGEYVMILDGDDVFEPKMVERLMASALAGSLAGEGTATGKGAVAGEGGAAPKPVDVVVCRSDQFDNETKAVKDLAYSIRMEQIPAHDPFSPEDMSDYVFSAFVGWPWDKLYRRAFLEEKGLKFPDLKNSEDFYFVFLAIAFAEGISVCDEVLIHHRMNRSASISASRLSAPGEFYRGICLLKERLKENPRYHRLEWGFLNWALDYTLWNIITLPQGEARAGLIRGLMRGAFPELELEHHGKEYYGLYPRSAMAFDLLKAEYEGVEAPLATIDDVNPRLGLFAQAFATAHHFGWGAAKWQFDEWRGRRSQSGSDVTAVKATHRGRSHWFIDKPGE